MNFQISDKVVCVDAVPRAATLRGEWEFPNGFIKHGEVYTVHLIAEESFRSGSIVRLHIVGKPAIWRANGQQYGWHQYRFRRPQDLKGEAKTASKSKDCISV